MSMLMRTHSSPNLKSPKDMDSEWEYHFDKLTHGSDDEEFYVIGDRVLVDDCRSASVAYFGEVEFASGDWVGVVLDEPTGNHSGKVHGREYFQCAPLHGLFVRMHRVRRLSDSARGSSATSSRGSTPMQAFHGLTYSPTYRRSKSPGTSTLDSYFYDDDYRPEKRPTIESLTRKLRSLDERNDSIRRQDSVNSNIKKYPEPTSGILKTSKSKSAKPRPSSSASDRTQRDIESSVFNFRPRREKLDQYSIRPQYSGDINMSPSGSSYNDNGRTSLDMSSEPPKIGDKVTVRSERGDLVGYLRFMGETEFATGEWAGVELEGSEGKNDGSVLGVRYFYCPEGRGLFVPAIRVKKFKQTSSLDQYYSTSVPIFKTVRSTITSPPPKSSRSHLSSSSTTPSSYLDDSSPSLQYSSQKSSSLSSPMDYQSSYAKSTSRSDGQLSDPLKLNTGLLNSRSPNFDYFDQEFNSTLSSSYRDSYPKFDDSEIEYQLNRALRKPILTRVTSRTIESPVKPKSIKYTFSTSKYDGNPIAKRTVRYD